MTTSKLFVHKAFGGSKWAKALVVAGANGAVLVDDLGDAEDLLNLPHRPIIICRTTVNDSIELDKMVRESVDPKSAAKNYIGNVQHVLTANPDNRIYWQGKNEPVPDTLAQMEWYSNFEGWRTYHMGLQGRKTAIGAFSVGRPDVPKEDRTIFWRSFKNALISVVVNEGLVLLHEYFRLPSFAINPDTGAFYGPAHLESPFYVGRFQWIISACKEMEIECPDIVLAETGADAPDWRSMYFGRVFKEDDYWRDLLHIENLLQHYPRVKGGAVFTLGGLDSWPHHTIENTTIPSKLFMHYATYVSPIPAPPDDEEPPIIPPPEVPPLTTSHKFAPRTNKYVADLFETVFPNNYLAVMRAIVWQTEGAFSWHDMGSILDALVAGYEYNYNKRYPYQDIESLVMLTEQQRGLLIAQHEAWHWE